MLINIIKDRLELFKEKNYRNVCLSGLFATCSYGIMYVASSWYAYEIMGSISGVALMMFVLWLPSILLGPFAGAFADKYDYKNLVFISCFGRGGAILSFSLYQVFIGELNIFFLIALFGLFHSLYMPSVIPLITTVLPKNDFVKANSTIDLIYELGTIFGMSLSGVLIHYFDMNTTLMFSGVLFLISSIFISLVQRNLSEVKKVSSSLFEEYKKTLNYLKSNEELYFLYFTQSFINTLMMTIPILIVPYIKEYLSGGTGVFSLFETIYSIGIFTGCLSIDKLEKKYGATKSLMFLLTLMGTSLLLMAQVRIVEFSAFLYFLCGISLATWALALSQVQLKTKLEFQGKLQAISNSFSGIFVLSIYLVVTLKKDLISIESFYMLIALLCFSMVVLTQLKLRPYKNLSFAIIKNK